MLSMTGSIFVALTILYNKSLQGHPNKLIAYICMAEALSCSNAVVWSINAQFFACYFDLQYLLSWTMFFQNTPEKIHLSLEILGYSNQVSFQYFQLLSLFLNMCLCIDLILTLMNPFYPGKRRLKFYLLFSVLISSILINFIQGRLPQSNCSEEGFQSLYLNSNFTNMILAATITFYILIAIYSCIYAFRRLTRPGMSKEIRKFFLVKHISYVTTFIFIWTIFLGSSYYHLFNMQEIEEDEQVSSAETFSLINIISDNNNITTLATQSANCTVGRIDQFSSISSFSTGILLTLVRISEPYFRFLIKQKILQLFGQIIDDGDSAYHSKFCKENLNALLLSSLNVELINIILKGVTKFCQNQYSNRLASLHERAEIPTEIEESIEIEEFKVQRLCTLNKILIENPDQWEHSSGRQKQNPIADSQSSSRKIENIATLNQNPISSMCSDDDNLPKSPMEQIKVLEINEVVKIVEYAPYIFENIREMDDIPNSAILKSLNLDFNRESVFRAGESQGKSGSFFFFSFDKKFLIKTMNDSELIVFQKMFPDYYNHLKQFPHSLLARIYGIYTVHMEDIVPVHLILMGNTVQVNSSSQIENVFDLKGSIFNRHVTITPQTKPTSTLKDQNFLQMCKEKLFLRFQKEDRRQIIYTLESDIQFLVRHNIMDYSLLLAIENNPDFIQISSKTSLQIKKIRQSMKRSNSLAKRKLQRRKTEQRSYKNELVNSFDRNRHRVIGVNGKYIYHIGVIDYLQSFDFSKKCECFFKTEILNRDPQQISAVNPKIYANRFYKFMREKVFVDMKMKTSESLKDSWLKRSKKFE